MGRITKTELETAMKGISAPALRELKILANNSAGSYVDGRVLRTLRSRDLVSDAAEGKVKINQLGRAVLKAAE